MGDTRGGSTRAKNVLQHGLLWMTEDRFRDRLNERGKKMLQALIDMKEGVKGDHVLEPLISFLTLLVLARVNNRVCL